MIDTNKLIPRRKEGVRISERTITTIGLVKKDVVKIDSLLKEKLVISKIRYGIIRQQNENDRRSGREQSLESKKSRPQDYDVNLKSNKKGKGFGGFLGGIFKAILMGLGFSIVQSLPRLIKIGKLIKTIAVPFTALVGVAFLTLRTIINVGSKVVGQARDIDPKKVNADSVNKSINNFRDALLTTVGILIGSQLLGSGIRRLIGGRLTTRAQAAKELLRSPKTEEVFNRSIRKEFSNTRTIKLRKAGLSKADAKLFDKINLSSSETKRVNEILAKNPNVRFLVSESIDEKFDKYYKAGGFKYNNLATPEENMGRFLADIEAKAIKRGDLQVVETAQSVARKVKTGEIKAPTPRKPREIVKSQVVQGELDLGVGGPRQLTIGDFVKRQREKRYQSKLNLAKVIDRMTGTPTVILDDPEADARVRQADLELEGGLGAELEREFGDGRPTRTRRKRKKKPFKSPAEELADTLKKSQREAARSGGKSRIARRRVSSKSVDEIKKGIDMKDAAKAARLAKKRAAKAMTKKGLSRLLFRVGGEAFEQGVKQIVKQSVSAIPLIGDLIGFLLDVFLFGQPVGRAAFMAGGSVLGGIIGGIFGLIGGPPGVLVGSILGGIGGDLLGGAFYDLIFKSQPPGLLESGGQAAVKKGIKAAGLPGFFPGGLVRFGGIVHAGEFVIDADSTRAIERQAPGFLSALNKAKGSQVNQVLETYMSYGGGEGEGSETLIPLPFEKVVTRTIVAGGESRDTGDFTSPFMDLYRRG